MPDDSADGTESSFRVQFTRFAEEIRQLATAVFGGKLDMVVTHLASRSRIFAEVPLTIAGENLARLKIDVWCCLDSYQQFLAVTESTYQLIAQVDRRRSCASNTSGEPRPSRGHMSKFMRTAGRCPTCSRKPGTRHRTAWSHCTYP